MSDALRPLWDFTDLDATERRFRELLEAERDDAARAEVLTQLARVHGLRGEFERGEELLQEAGALAGASARVRSRIDLERGRVLRSSGHPERALPLFERATEAAEAAGELFIAADAAHMAAIAAPDAEGLERWTERGIELAQSGDGSARYWLGPLLNNLGWHHFEAGELEAALEAFEGALAAREHDPANAEALAFARYAVAKALRALGRAAEAAEQLEQAVAWSEEVGAPDGWYYEELAEIYAALGRKRDAREHAAKALHLLQSTDRGFEPDGTRARRLRRVAAGEA
jgi:tetratricopeptide (TPR) repeat protein